MKLKINIWSLVFSGILLFGTKYAIAQDEPGDRGYIVSVGQMAPDFTVKLDNGETVTLSSLRGKTVMLQFTASWCGVCRKEMPYIEKEIWQVLKNKNFVLIGIDRDEPLEKIIPFKQQTGISYPLALDPGAEVFKKFALEDAGVTRNVIINPEGKIVFLTRLYNRDEFELMKNKIFTCVEESGKSK